MVITRRKGIQTPGHVYATLRCVDVGEIGASIGGNGRCRRTIRKACVVQKLMEKRRSKSKNFDPRTYLAKNLKRYGGEMGWPMNAVLKGIP